MEDRGLALLLLENFNRFDNLIKNVTNTGMKKAEIPKVNVMSSLHCSRLVSMIKLSLKT